MPDKRLLITMVGTLAVIAAAQRIPQTRGVLVPEEGVVSRVLGALGLG